MYLEVVQWPESQAVMDDPDWIFIQTTDDSINEIIGNSAYAKVISIEPVAIVHNALEQFEDDDTKRLMFLNQLTYGYCTDCGADISKLNNQCYCRRDD